MDARIHEAILTDISRLTSCIRTSTRTDNAWNHTMRYDFIDGTSVTLAGKYSNRVMLPAAAGFDLLVFDPAPDSNPDTTEIAEHIVIEPVISWNLIVDDGDVFSQAITPNASCSWMRSGSLWPFRGLRFPDGRVEWRGPPGDFGIEAFRAAHFERRYFVADDISAWVMMVREVWVAQIAEEAAAAAKREAGGCACPVCGGHFSEGDAYDGDLPF